MLIPVMIGISLIIFSIMYFTPGDPARMILGEQATDEQLETLRREMGLKDPFLVRYFKYVKGIVFHGDLGTSYFTKLPVAVEISTRFPTTLLLATLSIIFAVILGVSAGIISATRQYSLFDNLATALSLFGVSMPTFWQGLMLIILFSVWLGWLPASGFQGPKYWILPVLSIGPSTSATIMRMTRSSMLEVLRQDYIRTARAKGLNESAVIMKHALPNAFIPVLTVIGLSFGGLLGGAVIAESIFSIPGLGKLMVDSIKTRNYPVIQGGILYIAIAFSVVNLVVDILYAYVDPRIKSMYGAKKARRK
jgi:peptide/nickel transport system permease protein